jgi:hypothetical protein
LIRHDLNLPRILKLFKNKPSLFIASDRYGHLPATKSKGQVVEGRRTASAADYRFLDVNSECPRQGGEGENGAGISGAVVFLGHRLSGHDPGQRFFIKQEDESDKTGQARQENGIVSSHLESYGLDIQLLERQPERQP